MEDINWKCDGECNEKLDQYSYAMLISNVQVLEVDDKGRIAASSSTGQQDEQLCYSCFTEKYEATEQLKTALKHCLSEIARSIELIETSSDPARSAYLDDVIEGPGWDKLNELVVYIAGELKK